MDCSTVANGSTNIAAAAAAQSSPRFGQQQRSPPRQQQTNRYAFGSHDEPGFEERWANRRIPTPPKTPCSDPLLMPFVKLRSRNANGSMTLDEELLRAIAGQFTVVGITDLPFMSIFEKLKKDNSHLTYYMYNDPDYVWAYLRCYPEQFAIDCDPRRPDYVRYLSKMKLVAKSDRRRYEREANAGNLLLDTCGGGSMMDDSWDKITYDEKMEQTTITHILALFDQAETKLRKERKDEPKKEGDDGGSTTYLPTIFIGKALSDRSVSDQVREYVGPNIDKFLYVRLHIFVVFGSQVSLRTNSYIDIVRSLTKKLRTTQGDTFGLHDLLRFVETSPYLAHIGLRSIGIEPDSPTKFDDFLMFLYGHKFLFRLRPRDQSIELRHGPIPHISEADIAATPQYDVIKSIVTNKDLERFGQEPQVPLVQCDGGDSSEEDDERDPRSFDLCVHEPSAYTMRWLEENFDQQEEVALKLPKSRECMGRRRVGANRKKTTTGESSTSQHPEKAANASASEPSDGWPPLSVLPPQKPDQWKSITGASQSQSQSISSTERNEWSTKTNSTKSIKRNQK